MKNYTKGFIVSNFLLVQTAAKLRNSQIYDNYKLSYSLNYSSFFQVIVHTFEKVIIRKIFPKYMDPTTSILLSFQVIHRYENLLYNIFL